jgi:predicted dehydrogenase
MSVAVGLVGAGPWATGVHAPLLAAGPETHLAAVWARRPEAAQALADAHGTRPAPSFDALLDACEAVAFAVPPSVQADLAAGAAAAGKALLLEKPLAEDLQGAERLAASIEEAGVPSMMFLTWRYLDTARKFLEQVPALDPLGGVAHFLTGAFLGGPFATPWRLERGAWLDLGPHVLDFMDAALGPITEVRAMSSARGWVSLALTHATGASSAAAMCASVREDLFASGVTVHGRLGSASFDPADAFGPGALAEIPAQLARITRREERSTLDAARGLHLQRLIDQAEQQLESRSLHRM